MYLQMSHDRCEEQITAERPVLGRDFDRRLLAESGRLSKPVCEHTVQLWMKFDANVENSEVSEKNSKLNENRQRKKAFVDSER